MCNIRRGINEHDFGARRQMPQLGLFSTQDPLKWDNPDVSPYLYCAANPIRFIDPTGLVVLDNDNRHTFPLFSKIVDNLDKIWINKSMEFKHEFKEKSGGLSEEQINELTYKNHGPRMTVGKLSSESSYAETSTVEPYKNEHFQQWLKNDNVKITISTKLANLIETSASQFDFKAAEFLLEATIFHEFTHLGNAFLNNAPNGIFEESGHAFEEAVYGKSIQYNNYKSEYFKYNKNSIIPFVPSNKISINSSLW